MRIVGGRMRGLGLTPVGKGDASGQLRPTSDRVREAMFNLLLGGRFGDPVTDARVLDIFAGTGALGLEALSRGADHATFVETGRVGGRLVAANIEKTGASAECNLIRRDATRLGACNVAPYNLVFLDPPYGKGLGARAIASTMTGGWLADSAIIVWEEGAVVEVPSGFRMLESRRYGETIVTILMFGE